MASPSFLPSLAAIHYPGSSTFDELDRDDLRYTYGVEDNVQVIIPTGIHQYFNPPASSSTFFKEQFVAGLRLPIHTFFSEVYRYFRIPLGQLTPNSIKILYGFVVLCDVSEVLTHASEVQPLPISDMEIMRRGRVILQRRALPHSSSTSIGKASRAHPPPRPTRQGSSGIRPASLAHPTRPRMSRLPRPTAPTRPRAARPPRPATPARPRAARPPRPTASTPLQPVSSPRATYIPDLGLGERRMGFGGGTGNVSFVGPASREASQAVRRARVTNERLSQDAPSPSRHRARSPSDDSDSDDQPLAQRRRRQAPRPVSDSGPSSVPSPPPNAAASPPPPHVTPPPIPSPVNDPPISSDTSSNPRWLNLPHRSKLRAMKLAPQNALQLSRL
ncbi:protein transport protein sec31-like [Zingiber officinale]|uniref:protein transport protein sec31-like n=1 Tax=Zingiber officinale TaxID=94328 RepID=UPI001C4C29BA|nr:protein transport protein sec31-like [Zingiber officinale]